MRLVFGWDLDGNAYPESDGAGAGLGAACVGPAGLTDVLERWLGLGGPQHPMVVRIAQQLRRIQAVSTSDAFYTASLAVDPWATARELLRWRDALVAGGWRGAAVAGGGTRLAALAEIEAAALPLAPGSADRERALATALEAETRRPPIAVLRVATPCHLLPPPWPSILQRLSALGVTVTDPPPAAAVATGDIGAVGLQLAGRRDVRYHGDGSVALLDADDPLQAADVLAGWLAGSPLAEHGLVLIRNGGSVVLDEAFNRVGLPRPGGSAASPLRGALQLLPLAFELAWMPLDPARLLELLHLPGSPIPAGTAWHFARALREQPGVGGPAWQEAWTAAIAQLRERLSEQGLEGRDLERKLNKKENDWHAWLNPRRFDPADGLPVEEAGNICRRVQALMMRRAAQDDDPLLKFAAGVAGGLIEAIVASGAGRLSRPQLGRMIDAVQAEGTITATQAGEASPWAVIDTPGQIWGRAQTIIWWDFRDPGLAGAMDPWSQAERAALARSGVAVEPPSLALRRAAFGWRGAVAHADRRLLLVRSRTVAGTAVAVHPLWHEVTAGRGAAEVAGLVVDAGDALVDPEFTLLGRRSDRTLQAPLEVPGRCAHWPVKAGRIVPPKQWSATGIERLLGCRLAWTLRDAARIRAGDLVVLPDLSPTLGKLAHAIAAEIFADGGPGDAETAAAQACRLFDRDLASLAAPLTLPGQGVARFRARQEIVAGVAQLASLLAEAGLRVIACEVERQMPLVDSWLTGRLDMVCEAPDGRRIVLDLKWNKKPGGREDELREGRSVQLATYATLEAHQSGVPTDAGYYMVRQRRILFPEQRLFPPEARVDGPSPGSIWPRIDEARQHALGLLEAGDILAEGDDMRDAVELPEPVIAGLHAACRFCEYGTLCGVRGD